MNRYEKRLQKDVDAIATRVIDVAERVNRAVKDAVHALLTLDRDLAYRTILGDHRVNREVREIDRRCHAFVVRHLPSARHLRMVSAVMRIARELERIGDYAATISRQAAQLDGPAPDDVARDIKMLAEQARGMLDQAIRSFCEQNPELARGTMAIENQIDTVFDNIFLDLIEQEGSASLKDLFSLLVVLNRLERVSDRAKNICVEVVFWTTGEGKAPKVFRVLFLDQKNACLSQMAEAIAAKAYPEGGRFVSAGLEPDERINEHVEVFMDSLGCDLSDRTPRQFDASHDMIGGFHVIVGLNLDPSRHIEEVPFHTVLLQWDVPDCPQTQDEASEAYRELAHEIGELMETLHGDEAA
jgi:phosphate transport system protein